MTMMRPTAQWIVRKENGYGGTVEVFGLFEDEAEAERWIEAPKPEDNTPSMYWYFVDRLVIPTAEHNDARVR